MNLPGGREPHANRGSGSRRDGPYSGDRSQGIGLPGFQRTRRGSDAVDLSDEHSQDFPASARWFDRVVSLPSRNIMVIRARSAVAAQNSSRGHRSGEEDQESNPRCPSPQPEACARVENPAWPAADTSRNRGASSAPDPPARRASIDRNGTATPRMASNQINPGHVTNTREILVPIGNRSECCRRLAFTTASARPLESPRGTRGSKVLASFISKSGRLSNRRHPEATGSQYLPH